MASRVIDGPDKDWLDIADLVHLMRQSETTIRRLIRVGEFPAPVEVTKGSRMWHWSDMVFWNLRKGMGTRLAKEGQEGPTTGQEGPTGESDP